MKTIFVSSTFKDMHLERDIIRDKVTPMVNNVAKNTVSKSLFVICAGV